MAPILPRYLKALCGDPTNMHTFHPYASDPARSILTHMLSGCLYVCAGEGACVRASIHECQRMRCGETHQLLLMVVERRVVLQEEDEV